MSFDPNSTDSMFSRIVQRLDQQDKTTETHHGEFLKVLGEIRDEVKKTNGRVTGLEKWRTEVKAKVALLAVLVSAGATAAGWVLEHVWK